MSDATIPPDKYFIKVDNYEWISRGMGTLKNEFRKISSLRSQLLNLRQEKLELMNLAEKRLMNVEEALIYLIKNMPKTKKSVIDEIEENIEEIEGKRRKVVKPARHEEAGRIKKRKEVKEKAEKKEKRTLKDLRSELEQLKGELIS